MRPTETARGLPRLWPLLFPLTYVLHVAEETWCGEGFPAWASRLSGVALTQERFLALNAVALGVMLAICLLAAASAGLRWLVIPFAAAVLLNGSAHTAATLFTATYSPGLFSGLLVWVPLGFYTLRRTRPLFSRATFWSAVALGLALHGLLLLTVLSLR